MGKEIEHKYLVNDTSFLDLASGHSVIKQGYICREKERTVRVRLCDEKAFLTIKGKNQGDKREALKRAEANREMARHLRSRS